MLENPFKICSFCTRMNIGGFPSSLRALEMCSFLIRQESTRLEPVVKGPMNVNGNVSPIVILSVASANCPALRL